MRSDSGDVAFLFRATCSTGWVTVPEQLEWQGGGGGGGAFKSFKYATDKI